MVEQVRFQTINIEIFKGHKKVAIQRKCTKPMNTDGAPLPFKPFMKQMNRYAGLVMQIIEQRKSLI